MKYDLYNPGHTEYCIERARDMRAEFVSRLLRRGFASLTASVKTAGRAAAYRPEPNDLCSQK
jgi:hypothetical protein